MLTGFLMLGEEPALLLHLQLALCAEKTSCSGTYIGVYICAVPTVFVRISLGKTMRL